MRSTFFLTASLVVHAICFTALAVNHFKPLPFGGESGNGTEVEVAIGEGTLLADASGVTAEPEMKPLPVKEEVKSEEIAAAPLPAKIKEEPKKETPAKKAVAVKKAKKVVKAQPKIATELPAKEKTEQPENMDPVIEDSQAVAVPEDSQQDEKFELIPVKDAPPAGVQAATTSPAEAEDKMTEATSQDVNQTKDPAPVEGDGQGASNQPLNKGGDTKSEAVSYLDLKQYSGNKPPVYPLSARKEQRQGQVDLLYRVAKDGRVAEVQVAKSSGHPDLDEAAVKAIAKFKFVPGQEGWARHPVVFALKGVATTLPSKLRGSAAAAE